MRAINLLPRDAVARKSFKDEDPAVVIGSALGAVVILALGAGFLNVHSKVGNEQFKLDAARTQLAGMANQHLNIPKHAEAGQASRHRPGSCNHAGGTAASRRAELGDVAAHLVGPRPA